ASGWGGDIRPTFRPDNVVDLLTPGWMGNIADLGEVSGININSYANFIAALEKQRSFFKSLGATASDQAAISAYTHELSPARVESIFQSALSDKITLAESAQFSAHMLMESARMSLDDGLVMQIHIGSIRNHNVEHFAKFGPDKGADIPVRSEFTHNLSPLLNKYGNEAGLSLILFTLDESAYARELAPLAGHYPALKLGPPWWFYDSINGMRRYFDMVMETAGIYNTTGFNDDTRAFPSIPARHDVWRRASVNWAAGLVVQGIIDMEDASAMVVDLAYNLARQAYKFNEV
ncbi:MAG: glucuronate isomerase, partial [Anaerolineae bacterium]|nr:glucuronate isomerase [Anaerolineae bacterium]